MSTGPYRHLEYLPEPEDPRMLTAIDPDAPGYPPEAYGVGVEHAEAWRQATREAMSRPEKQRPFGIFIVITLVAVLLISYPWVVDFLGPTFTPDSQWAYDDTGITELQENYGLTGAGVRICIVDTGVDLSHPDLSGINLVAYKDFIAGDDSTVQDRGTDMHGTMMVGILAADGHLRGAAPGADIIVAAALGSDGTTQSESIVAQAVLWCWSEAEADIISLSLGGDPDPENPLGSETANAVRKALENGVFVVAAAGNSGGAGTEVTDVSVPANVDGVIAVGAIERSGDLWNKTATGSATEGAEGDIREEPHQKPEVVAPGVGIISTSSTALAIPYSSSTGTSDATVFVTGALALILERHGSDLTRAGIDADRADIDLVKQALADSCVRSDLQGDSHHLRYGYGSLDAIAWERAVADAISARGPE